MSNHPKIPIGSLFVDARPLADFLVDLERGKRQGLRTARPGFPDVIDEIVSNQREYGEKAGITRTQFERFMQLNHQIAQLDERIPAVKKLGEVLEETRAVLENERQNIVSGFATSVESSAKSSGDRTLLARYEKTREYRSADAKRGWKTRMQNAAAAAQANADADKTGTDEG